MPGPYVPKIFKIKQNSIGRVYSSPIFDSQLPSQPQMPKMAAIYTDRQVQHKAIQARNVCSQNLAPCSHKTLRCSSLA